MGIITENILPKAAGWDDSGMNRKKRIRENDTEGNRS